MNNLVLLSGISSILMSLISFAHHSFVAEFDAKEPVTLKGVVTKVEWINPHAWIHLEVKRGGKAEKWHVEAGSPNALIRQGLDRNQLKPGVEIEVRGYRSHDKNCSPACLANGRDLVMANGTKFFVGSKGAGAPPEKKK